MKKLLDRAKKAATHPLAKGSAVVLTGTMIANVGSYLYHLVVGRIMGPAQYGELAALLSLSYILNVFTVLLQTVITKFVAEKNAKRELSDVRFLLARLTAFLAMAGALGMAVLFFAAPYIAAFLHVTDTVVIYFLFIGILFTFLGMSYSSVLQGLQRFTAGMVLLNANSFLRLISAIGAASYGVTATLGANTFATILSSLMAIWPIRRILFSRKSAAPFSLRPLFTTSIATFFVLLGINVINTQDLILVRHFLPAVEAGWYGALSIMGKIIFFASSSVVYVLLPIVSDRSARGSHTGGIVYASVGIVAVLSLGITAGFFLLPRLALGLLYGQAFVAAAPYLGFFGIFSSLYTVAYTVTISLLGMGKNAVWGFVLGVAIAQEVLISMFHGSVSSVLWVNIVLSAVLTAVLLLYYRHATQER